MVKVADKVKTVNVDSGEVGFLLVTGIFGSQWFGRRIPDFDAGPNPLTMRVGLGTYGPVSQQ